MLKTLSTVLLATSVAACVDARKSFDDYSSSVVDSNTSMPDHPVVDQIPDATGHFLLSVHVAAAGPTSKPILFVADYMVTVNSDGTGKLAYAGSALNVDTHQLATDAPPPPQFSDKDMIVGHDGTFVNALTGTLPGDANPVSKGTPVDAVAEMHGVIMTKDLICGTLTGTALVDLSGSTFAAIRIPDGQLGNALPTPVTACP